MNALFNIETLTETQKNALFAFGEKDKTGTGCNLMIAASMCEGQLTGVILMSLADLIESVGITDEEFEGLIYQIRLEAEEIIMNMEKDYQSMTGKKAGTLPWREFARKKILAAFGNDTCGTTAVRLNYIEYVTVDPDLKQIVHDMTSQIASMNVFHPEKYPELLADARKVDELWKVKVDDLGYFTVKQ
jgi:hypothetical protein